MRSKPGPPMTLANMRQNGVRSVAATCEACGHKGDVNVDALPETVTVPRAGQHLRCTACGGKRVLTRPAWHTAARNLKRLWLLSRDPATKTALDCR
jgi:hypothetical protein